MIDHKVASRQEWLAREKLLEHEKEHTRVGDELARQRRELPWVLVEKEYRFETSEGTKTLAELFDGRSQLLVYHFMFGPSYEAGCPTNSSIADAINGFLPHLHARDATMVLVSRAPRDKLQAYKRRMGWSIPWASDGDSGFNFDYGFSSTEEQTREWVAPMLESGAPEAARSPSRPQSSCSAPTAYELAQWSSNANHGHREDPKLSTLTKVIDRGAAPVSSTRAAIPEPAALSPRRSPKAQFEPRRSRFRR